MNPFAFAQADNRDAALEQVAGNASFAGEAVRFMRAHPLRLGRPSGRGET